MKIREVVIGVVCISVLVSCFATLNHNSKSRQYGSFNKDDCSKYLKDFNKYLLFKLKIPESLGIVLPDKDAKYNIPMVDLKNYQSNKIEVNIYPPSVLTDDVFLKYDCDNFY